MLCLGNISKDFTTNNMVKAGIMNMCTTFLMIVILLVIAILIFINI